MSEIKRVSQDVAKLMEECKMRNHVLIYKKEKISLVLKERMPKGYACIQLSDGVSKKYWLSEEMLKSVNFTEYTDEYEKQFLELYNYVNRDKPRERFAIETPPSRKMREYRKIIDNRINEKKAENGEPMNE